MSDVGMTAALVGGLLYSMGMMATAQAAWRKQPQPRRWRAVAICFAVGLVWLPILIYVLVTSPLKLGGGRK